tara:strand:+ start:239 stop:658 length:420 start_codon:yes stop_codon:yes gene_type:complete
MLSVLVIIMLTGRAIVVDGTEKGVLRMIAYNLTLTCIGIMMGVTISKLKSNGQEEFYPTSLHNQSSKSVNLVEKTTRFNVSEQFIIDFLNENGGQCMQNDLVKSSEMTNSKISRILSKMEARGIVSRARDGMGKRVYLE